MQMKRTDFMILIVSVCCFLLMAVSFLIMPLGSTQVSAERDRVPILAGSLFWGFLLVGIGLQVLLAYRRRSRLRYSRNAAKGRPGVLRFFRTPPAVIADVCLPIALIGAVISMLVTDFRGYVCYVFIALFAFSLACHCIFNGEIYYYIMYSSKTPRRVTKAEPAYKQVKGEVEDYEEI